MADGVEHEATPEAAPAATNDDDDGGEKAEEPKAPELRRTSTALAAQAERSRLVRLGASVGRSYAHDGGEKEKEKEKELRVNYLRACEAEGVPPCGAVLRAVGAPEVSLGHYSLGARGGVALVSVLLQTAQLQTLELHCAGLEGRGVLALGSLLKRHEQLTTLTLSNNPLGVAAPHLLRAVACSRLTSLDLGSCGLSDAAGAQLAVCLTQQTPRTVASLHLPHNLLGRGFAEALAPLLVASNSALTTLDVAANRLTRDAASPLLRSLQDEGARLTSIDLSRNRLADDAALMISEALEANAALTSLKLASAAICGETAAIALATALRWNTTLTELDLRGNPLGERGTTLLLEAQQRNDAMQLLSVVGGGADLHRLARRAPADMQRGPYVHRRRLHVDVVLAAASMPVLFDPARLVRSYKLDLSRPWDAWVARRLVITGTANWRNVVLNGAPSRRHKRWTSCAHLPKKGELSLMFSEGGAGGPARTATGRSRHRFDLSDEGQREDLVQMCERAAAEPGQNLVNVQFAESAKARPQPFHAPIEEPGWSPPEEGILSFEYISFDPPYMRTIDLQLASAEDRAFLLKLAEEPQIVWRQSSLDGIAWNFSQAALRAMMRERGMAQSDRPGGGWGHLRATLVSSKPWKVMARAVRIDLARPSQRHVGSLLQLWSHVDVGENWFFERIDGVPLEMDEVQMRLDRRFADARRARLVREHEASRAASPTTNLSPGRSRSRSRSNSPKKGKGKGKGKGGGQREGSSSPPKQKTAGGATTAGGGRPKSPKKGKKKKAEELFDERTKKARPRPLPKHGMLEVVYAVCLWEEDLARAAGLPSGATAGETTTMLDVDLEAILEQITSSSFDKERLRLLRATLASLDNVLARLAPHQAVMLGRAFELVCDETLVEAVHAMLGCCTVVGRPFKRDVVDVLMQHRRVEADRLWHRVLAAQAREQRRRQVKAMHVLLQLEQLEERHTAMKPSESEANSPEHSHLTSAVPSAAPSPWAAGSPTPASPVPSDDDGSRHASGRRPSSAAGGSKRPASGQRLRPKSSDSQRGSKHHHHHAHETIDEGHATTTVTTTTSPEAVRVGLQKAPTAGYKRYQVHSEYPHTRQEWREVARQLRPPHGVLHAPRQDDSSEDETEAEAEADETAAIATGAASDAAAAEARAHDGESLDLLLNMGSSLRSLDSSGDLGHSRRGRHDDDDDDDDEVAATLSLLKTVPEAAVGPPPRDIVAHEAATTIQRQRRASLHGRAARRAGVKGGVAEADQLRSEAMAHLHAAQAEGKQTDVELQLAQAMLRHENNAERKAHELERQQARLQQGRR